MSRLLFIPLIFISLLIQATNTYPPFKENNAGESREAVHWADSVLQTMTLEQQIAQLVMIRAHSNKSVEYKRKVERQIKEQQVGGVCFFQGGPQRQAYWVEQYQKAAKIPLLVAIDGEWGLGMRLDSTVSYPFQMTLGAVRDNYLIRLMGEAVGKELKAVGVNMNFAPVMDVNNNPDNPVINFRSFGEDPFQVYEKAISYARGMQSQNIIACGKHFPGHGDTDQDSHHTLPVIKSSEKEMHDIHLLPFKLASAQGLGSIMTAHVHVQSLDTVYNRPSSLSPQILTNILKKTFNYRGLIVTDALEMAGVRKGYQDGRIAVEALKAGNDILLMPADLEKSLQAVRKAVDDGEILAEEIREKARKVLVYKYWAGIKTHRAKAADIDSALNQEFHRELIRKLYEEAMTLLKNDSALLPFGDLSKKKLAVVTVGKGKEPVFLRELRQYADFDEFHISSSASLNTYTQMAEKLAAYDLVITGLHSSSLFPGSNYGLSQRAFDFTELTGQKTKNVVILFGNPYALKALGRSTSASALLVAYQNNKYTQEAAVEALFGAIATNGRLPVSASEAFQAGEGLSTAKQRLEETSPFFMNIDRDKLQQIDSIARSGISKKAYPGCQILIAKDGKIFYHKAFGYHTYDQIRPVQKTDLYDLASVTKIAAATIAVMRLQDDGRIDIDQRLSTYLKMLEYSDKRNIIIREMMAHQSGLYPWIPFYKKTINVDKVSNMIYHAVPDSVFTMPVADKLYTYPGYQDSILKEIAESRLLSRNIYKYSDLGFYMLKFVIENQSEMQLEEYVAEKFYRPMGLKRITYSPLTRFSRKQIPPTEDDRLFRGQLVHGYVHDPGAAMMGGVSGHAGLFSNASDLAAIMQMLLNNGTYAGQRFLDSATVKEFTSRQFPLSRNRRGIGFDKPLPDNQRGGPTAREASNASFGHSGFTGTYAWADPEHDLIYIFLSNRVYPDAENRKLISMGIRTKIQAIIYQALNKES